MKLCFPLLPLLLLLVACAGPKCWRHPEGKGKAELRTHLADCESLAEDKLSGRSRESRHAPEPLGAREHLVEECLQDRGWVPEGTDEATLPVEILGFEIRFTETGLSLCSAF